MQQTVLHVYCTVGYIINQKWCYLFLWYGHFIQNQCEFNPNLNQCPATVTTWSVSLSLFHIFIHSSCWKRSFTLSSLISESELWCLHLNVHVNPTLGTGVSFACSTDWLTKGLLFAEKRVCINQEINIPQSNNSSPFVVSNRSLLQRKNSRSVFLRELRNWLVRRQLQTMFLHRGVLQHCMLCVPIYQKKYFYKCNTLLQVTFLWIWFITTARWIDQFCSLQVSNLIFFIIAPIMLYLLHPYAKERNLAIHLVWIMMIFVGQSLSCMHFCQEIWINKH